MPVIVFGQRLCQLLQLHGFDEAIAVGNFFKSGHFQTLSDFDGLNEIAGFHKALVGAGVKPSIATVQAFQIELVGFKVCAVQICNLKLAPRRWLEVGGDVKDLVFEEKKACDGIVALGAGRLFL
jgi:hypothetical protein